jgi:hypothetical protein
VTFQALADGSSVADAKASAAGADKKDEADSGKNTADDQTAKQTSLANAKSGKDNSVDQTANTDGDGGSGGSVGVAAALAINVSRSDALAEIPSGITITAGGLLTLESSNNMDASALADGSATEGSIDTAIGVAVAINVAHMTNLATVADGANVTAEGVQLSAAMKDVGGDTTHRFTAKATSGASGGDVGVAGSFALNVSNTVAEAALRAGSTVAAGSGDVTIDGGEHQREHGGSQGRRHGRRQRGRGSVVRHPRGGQRTGGADRRQCHAERRRGRDAERHGQPRVTARWPNRAESPGRCGRGRFVRDHGGRQQHHGHDRQRRRRSTSAAI